MHAYSIIIVVINIIVVEMRFETQSLCLIFAPLRFVIAIVCVRQLISTYIFHFSIDRILHIMLSIYRKWRVSELCNLRLSAADTSIRKTYK